MALTATPPAQTAPLKAQPLTIRAADGYALQGELSLPAGARAGQKFPLVILLHGSVATDLNETVPGEYARGKGAVAHFLQIAQRLNAAGYAVFRYNKRGVTGIGPILLPENQRVGPAYTVSGYASDARAVLDTVRKLPQVDAGQVFLLGISEGTRVAAGLAGQMPQKVRGLVLIGTAGDRYRETVQFQLVTRQIGEIRDFYDTNKDDFLTIQEVTETAARLGHTFTEEVENFGLEQRDGQWVFPADLQPDAQGRVSIAAFQAMLEEIFVGYPNVPGWTPQEVLYAKDSDQFGSVTELLPKFNGPVLILHGADDRTTPLAGARKAFAAAQAAGNRGLQMNVYSGLAHSLTPTDKYGFGTAAPIAQGPLNDLTTWLGTVTGR